MLIMNAVVGMTYARTTTIPRCIPLWRNVLGCMDERFGFTQTYKFSLDTQLLERASNSYTGNIEEKLYGN